LRSLQGKFSTLLVTLLLAACASLGIVALRHERSALASEVEKRARVLALGLAGAARAPLALRSGGSSEAGSLAPLVEETAASPGVTGAHLLAPDGRMLATADGADGPHEQPGSEHFVSVPVIADGRLLGQAQVDLDVAALVDPVVRRSARYFIAVAIPLICLGAAAGVTFVALFVGPLRRLRLGVERLRDGDLSARVPPTSHDEVGELTRAFNEMGDSLRQSQRVETAFGRYVNDFVLNQLLEGPEEDVLGGIEREVTILFCDIRGFTHLSEDMEARKVMALLHEVFQLVSDRILERGGTIDKFIGDSVMAYFGAPVQQPDHAVQAVTAAGDILRSMQERNRPAREGRDPKLVPVEVGIGIHTGKVVVGNIGSDRRTDYTVIGDAVNVAHRLEKLARPAEVLVSEVVQRAARAQHRLRFEGERQLSGREEPVHVYSLELERAEGQSATGNARPRD